MKQKKIKIGVATLFVYRSKKGSSLKDIAETTDPTTHTVSTITSTNVFQQ